MRNQTHMRAVQRATEVAGGLAPLAAFLHVSPIMVAAWIQGTAELPAAALLKVVDIIVQQEGAHLRGAIPACEAEIFKHREAANS